MKRLCRVILFLPLLIALYPADGKVLENQTVHFNNSIVYRTRQPIEFKITAQTDLTISSDQITVFLFFSDGSKSQYDTAASELSNLSTAVPCLRSFFYQGNYSVYGLLLYNGTNYTTPGKTVYIWDPITMELSTKDFAAVNEQIQISFTSSPYWNVYYVIDFGDNNTIQNTAGSFHDQFVPNTIAHSYVALGLYNITLKAWNSMYTHFHSKMIKIEHPIPTGSLSISPTTEYIPYPDGKVILTLHYSSMNQDPTSVKCKFNYGDGEETLAVNLTNNSPVERTHFYQAPGTMNVVFTCTNGISEQAVQATMYVESYSLSDFNFSYPNPVVMSMELEPVIPTSEYRHFYKSVTIPVTVTFTISMKNFKKFPPGLSVTWDFKDGAPPKTFQLVSPQVTHTFSSKRGTYAMVIKIESGMSVKTYILNITLGVIQFSCIPQRFDLRDTYVSLYAKGIYGSPSYFFNVDTANYSAISSSIYKENDYMNGTQFTFKYMMYGFYFPSVYAVHANGERETVFLDQFLIADLSVKDSLSLIVQPKQIPLPPGYAEFKVISYSSTTRPFVTCEMKPGDAVDRDSVYVKTQNISSTEPLVFKYVYTSLGANTVTIKCSNYISVKTMTEEATTVNTCFDPHGIFDRQHSIPTNPLKVFSAYDLYISNRMNILCQDENANFEWNLFQTDNTNTIGLPIDYENPLKEGQGRFLIKRKSFTDGLYNLTLNVTLSTTWISEYMFIQFHSSHPFAYIVGGDYVIGSKDMTFDALAESRMDYQVFGGNENLTFSWKCTRISRVQLTQTEVIINETPLSTCSFKEIPHGVVQLSSGISTDYEYAVTVTVHQGSSQRTFTQIASITEEGPTLAINCSLNCNDKVAISSKIALVAWCQSCVQEETIKYDWKIWEELNGKYHVFQLSADVHENDTTSKKEAFVISSNLLNPGKKYIVTLFVTTGNETEQEGKVYRRIHTNVPPTGGICSVTLQTDIVSPTLSVNCSNWIDPDDSLQTLVYLYETVIRRNLTHGEDDIVTIVYEGSESSIADVPIQSGDPVFGYVVTVRVRIFDIYGDYGTFTKNITVYPPYYPTDESSIEASFVHFDKKFSEHYLSGNDIQTLCFIGAVASCFRQFPYKENTTREEDVLRGVKSIYIDDTHGGPIFLNYQKKVIKLMRLVEKIITPGCNNSQGRFNLADLQVIYSTLDALTRYQPYLTLQAVNTATAILNLEAVVGTLQNVTTYIIKLSMGCLEYGARDPLSVDSVDKLTLVGKVYHRVLDNVLNKMLPQKLQNLEEELSEEDIRSELVLKITRFLQEASLLKQKQENISLDHRLIDTQASFLYKIRLHERSKQIDQREMARINIPVILNTLQDYVKVLEKTVALGERIFLNGLHVLELMIRKVSVNNLSVTKDPFFAGINQGNGSVQHSTYLTLSVFNFLKNPFIYGENASLATSSVPVIEIPQNTSVDSIIPNNQKPKYEKYIPLMNPAFSEQMIFFSFDVINGEDAGLLYLKPDDLDMSNQKNSTLYSFYFCSTTFPTSSRYDYVKDLGIRDWTNYGFKVFLPGGVCGKGICYLGIKPLTVTKALGVLKSRKRRSLGNTSANETTTNTTTLDFVPAEANFSLIITTTGCRTWDNDNNSWTMDGCTVLPMSDLNNTLCRCIGDTFSSSFYVPPNVINFLTVWGKFDASNASVYGTLIGVFLIYLVLVILLRKQDRKDSEKWAVSFLSDHKTSDVYFYLISVYTGLRKGAGTKSNVYFMVTGEQCDTGIRVLNDGRKKEFTTSSVNTFFFGTTEPLGDLLYLRIWHDNTGQPGLQSWFLSKIIIDDLQSRERYFFYCNKWLAIDDGDCTLDRIIPVSTANNTSLKTRLSDETQAQITEHHLWLSLLLRPRQSKFTRVQRLSCLLALLCLIMISNAMFFRSSDENQNVDQVKFGILKISMSTFFISIIGILISNPPIIFASFVFSHINNEQSTKRNYSKLTRTCEKDDSHFTKIDASEMDVFQQKNDKFPHWLYYVAWIILALAVLSSCFFLILYSMEWGSAKSEEWISSFVFSVVESLVIVDPIKVLFLAITFTTVLKNMMQEDAPRVNLQKVRSFAMVPNKYQETNISDLTNYVLPTYDKLSKEEIKELRKKCHEESKAKAALRNLIFFTIYIIAIYLISYKERDQRSFYLKQNLENYLLTGKEGFSTIKNQSGFYKWLNKTFIQAYYPVDNYANEPLTVVDRQWFKDMASIRVGPARLRQVRMKSGPCKYSKLVESYPCIETYSEQDEDQSSYCVQWKPYNKSVCGSEIYKRLFYTADSWTYTDARDIWGISRMGEYKTYSGGGYILKFVKNKASASLLLRELVEHNWINRNTRAVFLEFTMYNPNVNLFLYAMLLAEFPEVGSVVTWTDIQAFKPILNLSSLGFGLVMSYTIVFFYYIFLLFKIIWNWSTFGCLAFIKEPWNVVDCISTLLAYSCFLTFIMKLIYTNTAMDMFYDDKLTGANRFINYGHIVIWDNAFNVFFAALVFASTIQILKILGYNKRFTEILAVITNARKDLLSFGIILTILLIAFVFLAYLLFGSRLENYKSIYITCGSLANTFIGKNKLDPLVIASPLTAQFFYMTYVFFVIMFMLTVFLSILNNSISAVRAETIGAATSLGILHIVENSIRNFVESVFKLKQREKSEKYAGNSSKKEINAVNVMTLIRDIVTIYGNEELKSIKKSNGTDEETCRLISEATSISLKIDSSKCRDLSRGNNDEDAFKDRAISRFGAVSTSSVDFVLHDTDDSSKNIPIQNLAML